MAETQYFGIIAGSGSYPFYLAKAARRAGETHIAAAAFENETDPALAKEVDCMAWMRVGQLGKLIQFFKTQPVQRAVMAGQIAPKNLFDLRPDFTALILLAKLRQRNAESIFGAIADELQKNGVELLPATTYLESFLAADGLIAGPKPGQRQLQDIDYGFQVAKEISRLDIGQTVIVKHGTVLAVEAFEGSNQAIIRGGQLGKKDAIMIKVSKPSQDMRFDVPVIGQQTIEVASAAKLGAIAIEAGKCLILQREQVHSLARQHRISIFGKTV